MKKKFITSSFLLLIGGLITKLLGMIIKIIISSRIGINGLALYMLVLPTFSLLITVSQAGVPLALSKLVASSDKRPHELYSTLLLFLGVYNIILLFLVLISANFISTNLLHNNSCYLPVIGIAFVIPFTTLSSIIRSYFIGIGNMLPPVISNLIENFIRFIFAYYLLGFFTDYSTSIIVFIIIIFNIVSELISTLFLLIFIPKRKRKITFNNSYLKEVMYLAIPNLFSSFIGSFTYFLEPIILLFLSRSNNISIDYGILTGYVYPLLLLPTFFVNATAQALLPILSNSNNKNTNRLLRFIILMILLFSVGTTFVFLLFGDKLLLFIYHNYFGFKYLRILSLFSFFLYIQPIFSIIFLSIEKTKYIFYTTLVSSFIRLSTMIIFLLFDFEIYSLIYSFLINVFCTFIYQIYLIKKEDILLF